MTLPNFFVVGAAKAGTTSLYNYLNQHPAVYMSPQKEPRFFAYDPGDPDFLTKEQKTVTTLEEYEALFAGVTDETAIGEASTLYLYSPIAPARIREAVPEARIVALLRNPADRAFSSYVHAIKRGWEPHTRFEEALAREPERVGKVNLLLLYRELGRYHEQLVRYFDLFGPSRVKVMLYEDFKDDPVTLTQDVFNFLGVDSGFVPDVSLRYKEAAGRVPRSTLLTTLVRRLPAPIRRRLRRTQLRESLTKQPEFPAHVRARLVSEFEDEFARLETLLGRDLSVWRKGTLAEPVGPART